VSERTTELLEGLEGRSVRHLSESAKHDSQIALMKFLSSVAKGHRVGKHVYVVGGAVRDFVLDKPIKDVDVVIDSLSLKGKDSEWFAKQLQREIPARTTLVTNNYGVAILTVSGDWDLDGHALGGEVIEIANARKESYGGESGKGYKPSDVEVATIGDDSKRREFTFNTLMWRLSDLARGPAKAEIVDLTGCGLRDLRKGEMRCPSDPDKTFSDDPTRMLRAIKFLVRYNWKIPSDVAKSIRRNASKLTQVPHEAIVSLLVKDILKEKTYKKALAAMDKLGLLTVISTMVKTNEKMAAALNKWGKSQKVKFLFDLLDVGIPVGKKIGFLSGPQKKKLRKVAETLRHDEVERLVSILQQPGKAMKSSQLIRELGLKGPQIKELMHVARDVLLERPNLVGAALSSHSDSDPYTNTVRREARDRGLGESEMFNVQFRVLTEAGADLELHVYDFDGTLFKSPDQPDWWKEKRLWWAHPSSLEAPAVPENPSSDWWNMRVVSDAKRSTKNPNVYAVLLTGRSDRVYRYRVPELLKQAGLAFDEVHLANTDDTKTWKLKMLKKLLSRFPDVRHVHIWEDADHLGAMLSLVEKSSRMAEGHRVAESRKQAACSEQEWRDVWK